MGADEAAVPDSLKVLHVITGLNDGGAEGALYRLCLHDKRNAHTVVSMMDEGKYGPLLRACGVEVHCLRMPQGRVTASGLWRLWRMIRCHAPDAVQTWLYHADLIGGVIARFAGVRNVAWGIRHSNLTPGTVKRSTIWVAKLCGFLSPLIPARIVCCSQQAVGEHVRVGYAADKFCVIPNGYDLSRLKPSASKREALRSDLGVGAKVLLGMVARFDVQKDHPNLLAALEELRRQGQDFHCLLVGTGMDAGNRELVHWLEQHGVQDQVSLLGRRNDIDAVMNAIDVHVLSSLGEAFPNVLAEAMACGTPCVTTDVGDAAYIVGDTGWIVPPQTSKVLATAIADAIGSMPDPAAWIARKQAARLRVEEHFTIEGMTAKYDAIWREGTA